MTLYKHVYSLYAQAFLIHVYSFILSVAISVGKPRKIPNETYSKPDIYSINYNNMCICRSNVMNVEAAEMTECNITVQEAAQRDQRPPQEEQESAQKDQRPPQEGQESAQKDQRPPQEGQEVAQRDQRPPQEEQKAAQKDQCPPQEEQESATRDQHPPQEEQEAAQKDQRSPQEEQEAATRDQRPSQEERNPFELPDIRKLTYEITECEAYGFLWSGDQSQ